MSSTWEEVKFYGKLASTLFGPKYDLHRVPGPPGTLGLGHITSVMRPDYHVQMLEWANEYGGVYKFCLGYQYVVVVSDPKVAVQILGRGELAIPRKCIGYQFFDLATNHLGAHSFFTTSDEQQWAAVRKAAAVAFSTANVRKAFPIALRHAVLMADSLVPPAGLPDPANPYMGLAAAAASSHPGQPPASAANSKETAAAAAAGKGASATAGKAGSSASRRRGAWLWSMGGRAVQGKTKQAPTSLQGKAQKQEAGSTAGAPDVAPTPLEAAVAVAVAVDGEAAAVDMEASCRCGTADACDCTAPGASHHRLSAGVAPSATTAAAMASPGKLANDGGMGGSCDCNGFSNGDCNGGGGVDGRHCAAAGSAGAAGGASSCSVSVDIQEHLELMLLNVFIEALFDIGAQDFPGAQVAHDMNLVLEEANERLKVPLRKTFMGLVQPKAQGAIWAAQRRLGEVYGRMHDVIRARGPPRDDQTDLWACLARIRHPKTGELLTRAQLIPEIGALVMAGFDTSSHSIAWTLFTLAAHPHAQGAVRRELAEAGLLHGPGLSPRELALEDLGRLEYLNAVIDETMRMYPVAATASVREVTQATRVGSYVIPPGVIVWPMLYALHNSTHNWEHPGTFAPERWLASGTSPQPSPRRRFLQEHQQQQNGAGPALQTLDEAGCDTPVAGSAAVSASASSSSVAALSQELPATTATASGPTQAQQQQQHQQQGGVGSMLPNFGSSSSSSTGGTSLPPAGGAVAAGKDGGKRYMPFSDGMKSCLGQALGLMEVRTVLVALLARYSFELDPCMGGPQAVRASMIMSLTLKMKGGLRLRCTPLGPDAGGIGVAAAAAAGLAPAGPDDLAA